MNSKEFLDILHVAERLKDTPRHCTTSKGRVESVAEHSWRISLMAFLLRDEFPQIDIDKVISMCIIHDLGECFTGDIPTFKKTNIDREKEDSLLYDWINNLPKNVSKEMKALFRVNAIPLSKLQIPLIAISHTYADLGSFIPK